jgi:hypothetical protein
MAMKSSTLSILMSQSSIGWIKDMNVFSKKLSMREHLLIMLWHAVCDPTEEIPSDRDSVSYLYWKQE